MKKSLLILSSLLAISGLGLTACGGGNSTTTTSEQPSLVKIKAAFVAIAIAEFFRDEGKDVLFMLDSITRIAMAQREVGLAIGEPPATRGYTPSVFALMPKILERYHDAKLVIAGTGGMIDELKKEAEALGLGNKVYFKPENLQMTGAYKLRGADCGRLR